MKVIFNHHEEQTILAEANEDQILRIEGNVYFSPETVKMNYLNDSDTPYTCPWKGVCKYHNGDIEGHSIPDLAWSYPNPIDGAAERVAISNDDKFGGNFAGFICFDMAKEGIEMVD